MTHIGHPAATPVCSAMAVMNSSTLRENKEKTSDSSNCPLEFSVSYEEEGGWVDAFEEEDAEAPYKRSMSQLYSTLNRTEPISISSWTGEKHDIRPVHLPWVR